MIEASDVGVINLSEETVESVELAPVDEVEIVADIEMGKVPDKLKTRFMSLYKLMESMSNIIDFSPTSGRYHFKVKKENGGKKGIGLLFSGRKPNLVLNFAVEGQKKQKQVYYNITEKGPVDADGKVLSVKSIQSIIRKFKKDRGI